MNEPLLEIDELTVRFPDAAGLRLIIEDVSLAIGAGEAVGLVGESGSGKTTTARSIIQLLPEGAVCSGAVRFGGRDVLAMTASEQRALRAQQVQIVFQDPKAYVNPVHSVGDFLTEALRVNRKFTRHEAELRVLALLEEVGVAQARRRLGQYPHELSGGLLQRIMIAAVLAVDPQLLIADEPTSALDVTTQADVVGLINRLRIERNMAVLFISHDLELASACCDRTAVMYAGRIVEDQVASNLHSAPLHPYTAALFASRPDVTRATPRLAAIPGQPTSAADAPSGCHFAPRCVYRIDECVMRQPPMVVRGEGRTECLRVDAISETLAAKNA